MPTGNQLKHFIGECVRFKEDSHLLFRDVLSHWARQEDKKPATYVGFGGALAETASTFPSIDEALHWWRHQKEIVELGKLTIAYFILDAERESLLGLRKHSGRES